MYVITKAALIASAAQRFRETYQSRGRWLTLPDGRSASEVYEALAALPPNATEEQVTALTGDSRWTENWCDECGADAAVSVCLGWEAHHPTETKNFCLQCLESATTLARGAA